MKKDYVKQNNPECLPTIQKVGCFFRSALHCVELATDYVFNGAEINELWQKAKNKGILDSNDNLKDSAQLMNLALRSIRPNTSSYFAEIGIQTDGIYSLYNWAQKRGLVPNYFIQKIKQGGPSVYHFIVVDDSGKLQWDPHTPAIKSLGEVYTICYRFFRGA